MRVLLAVSIVAVTASAASAATTATATTSGWSHGWDTPSDSWWGYGGLGSSPLQPDAVDFIAKTYPVCVISFCPGPDNATTQEGILAAAKQIKDVNPNVKILQVCEATSQAMCDCLLCTELALSNATHPVASCTFHFPFLWLTFSL